jgi:hypothetical protein
MKRHNLIRRQMLSIESPCFGCFSVEAVHLPNRIMHFYSYTRYILLNTGRFDFLIVIVPLLSMRYAFVSFAFAFSFAISSSP